MNVPVPLPDRFEQACRSLRDEGCLEQGVGETEGVAKVMFCACPEWTRLSLKILGAKKPWTRPREVAGG